MSRDSFLTKGYVNTDYLQRAATLLNGIKKRSYELMHIRVGDCVLDVGCGPGTDTIPLAQLTGERGRVIGVDLDPSMIAAANERSSASLYGERITHQVYDAATMPFSTDTFDACRSERLIQHLKDPAKRVAEIVRVTKRGGWIVITDTD
jgi:ubiquinone/menaquinone biosynthesis C-methylase UbiE